MLTIAIRMIAAMMNLCSDSSAMLHQMNPPDPRRAPRTGGESPTGAGAQSAWKKVGVTGGEYRTPTKYQCTRGNISTVARRENLVKWYFCVNHTGKMGCNLLSRAPKRASEPGPLYMYPPSTTLAAYHDNTLKAIPCQALFSRPASLSRSDKRAR